MNVVTKCEQITEMIQTYKQKGKTIGFVPTMGFLHEGHLTLIEKAKEQNDIVVLSIFVNPLQFGQNEDFGTYPRDFERDMKLAEKKGVQVLFAPSTEEMYPQVPSVTVHVTKRVDVLCGKHREGHFDGVATVLTKLFHLVQPNRVYFGLKDAQQVAVVHGLIKDFNFPIELVPVETVREEDGLAKSSRNVRLLPHERKEAPSLYHSLLYGKEIILAGERNPKVVTNRMYSFLEKRITGEIDYIEIYSYPELKTMDGLNGNIIIAMAVRYNEARLIDNITFEIK